MVIGPGTSLGPYIIRSLLGAGGMGEVFLAHDNRLGRDVAIEVFRPGSPPIRIDCGGSRSKREPRVS